MSLKVYTFKLSKKSMRYFAVFFFLIFTQISFSQEKPINNTFTGTIVMVETLLPIANVHIINKNLVKGTISDEKGKFEIPARVNDTLYISSIGFHPINIKVTNDWLKFKNAKTYTLAIAEKLDANKFDFKPVKEEMSFKEQLVHIGENIY